MLFSFFVQTFLIFREKQQGPALQHAAPDFFAAPAGPAHAGILPFAAAGERGGRPALQAGKKPGHGCAARPLHARGADGLASLSGRTAARAGTGAAPVAGRMLFLGKGAPAGYHRTRPAAERSARGITTSEIRQAAPMALPGL